MSKCVKCGNEILTGDIHWEMGLCNNCYNEAYKDHKTHISLDKMWLELARSFRDENEKLQDKIADLEAKFAESERELEKQKEKYDKLYDFYKKTSSEDLQDKYRLAEENEQLKQQLAEKEKYYDLKYKDWIKEIRESDRLREELAKTNKEWVQSIHDWKELCKKKDQDKILFALEQLDKVKGLIANHTQELWTCENDDIDLVLYEEIDNQINELKGKVKNE